MAQHDCIKYLDNEPAFYRGGTKYVRSTCWLCGKFIGYRVNE